MDLSVLILTKNEEVNLPGCLESVSWSDDVVVFDSFSTDGTRDVALARGARFLEREFDDYASQRNAALGEVEYKYPWILMIDADERVTPELAEEIKTVIENASENDALFRVRRKDYFLGRWLRRSSGYPTWFGRLVRAGRVRVTRKINEEYHADGNVGFLNEHLIHYPFNKGFSDWFERHNRYSSMEADLLADEASEPLRTGRLFSGDPTDRRRFLKRLAYRLPCRPTLVFVYLYFIRFGFLDGYAGLTYCCLRRMYERMLDLKVQETKRRKKGLPL